MLKRGYIHAYYGDGKGKTTAAIGLGIRGIGKGLKVAMIQFLKTKSTSELNALIRFGNDFKVFRLESPKGFYYQLDKEQKEKQKLEIKDEFELAKKIAFEFDMLILDEVLGTIENNILKTDELIEFIIKKPQKLELIITGRNLPEEVKEICNYVSRIENIKHPFDAGVHAREGIEF